MVGILAHPEETKNRVVTIESYQPTQQQLVSIYSKLLGHPVATTVVSTAEREAAGNAKVAAGDFSGFVDQIHRALYGEGYSGVPTKTDNELFGIKTLTEAELEAVVKASL